MHLISAYSGKKCLDALTKAPVLDLTLSFPFLLPYPLLSLQK